VSSQLVGTAVPSGKCHEAWTKALRAPERPPKASIALLARAATSDAEVANNADVADRCVLSLVMEKKIDFAFGRSTPRSRKNNAKTMAWQSFQSIVICPIACGNVLEGSAMLKPPPKSSILRQTTPCCAGCSRLRLNLWAWSRPAANGRIVPDLLLPSAAKKKPRAMAGLRFSLG